MLTYVLAAACFAGWLTAAGVLLAAGRAMAVHKAPVRRRYRAFRFARGAYTAMLVCAGGLAALGAARFGASAAGAIGIGTRTATLSVALVVALIIAFVLLAIITAAFPDLPGRPILRRIENAGFWLLVPALTIVFIVGARSGLPGGATYGAAGALALVIAFTLAARPFLRGSGILIARIAAQGSHPDTEATLKRTVRRSRPFVVAAAAALVVLGVLLA